MAAGKAPAVDVEVGDRTVRVTNPDREYFPSGHTKLDLVRYYLAVGEGIVRADSHPIQHERPEEWGWHGETGKWGRIGGWIAVVVTLTFLIGNHEGRVEDLWLIGLALLTTIVLVWDMVKRRASWRR